MEVAAGPLKRPGPPVHVRFTRPDSPPLSRKTKGLVLKGKEKELNYLESKFCKNTPKGSLVLFTLGIRDTFDSESFVKVVRSF